MRPALFCVSMAEKPRLEAPFLTCTVTLPPTTALFLPPPLEPTPPSPKPYPLLDHATPISVSNTCSHLLHRLHLVKQTQIQEGQQCCLPVFGIVA